MNDKWEFYKDAEGKWRWRRTAPNGNIVGASTEGYSNKIAAERNANRNGWINGVGLLEEEPPAPQLAPEEQELQNSKAYKLYRDRGFKDGTDFMDWLELERVTSERARSRSHKQLMSLVFIIGLLLCGIAGILLMTFMKKQGPVELSKQTLSELSVMMVVLDPKVDEKVLVFGDTYFGYDKSQLNEEAKRQLETSVESLKLNPSIHVRMAGYTSAEGSEQNNQKLSEQRAQAVRNYLIEQGIAQERITVIGYGRTRPAVYEAKPANINSKEALANMRVLFEVVVK